MAGRTVLATLFVAAGLLHFVFPKVYLGIMPPALPAPLILVYASGMCEVAGGVGLLVGGLRTAAAWGLVALLAAVWPANIYMAMVPGHFPMVPGWALWARVPLQLPMMYWAWLYTRN